jgi:hypothetical protein
VSSRNTFNRHERRLIRRLNTPQKVQRYLNALPYNSGETMRTFRGVVQHETSHCMEAALFAAVTLEQHGYPPLLLDLGSQDGLDHVLFLYRHRERFGTVARSRDPGLHGRRPHFTTIRQLVTSYAPAFVDLSGRIVEFGTYDLRSLTGYDWRLSSRNVWRVERELIAMSHEPFHMPDEEYDYWYRRYAAFKQRYPDSKPIFYPNRSSWAPGYPRPKLNQRL